jgi:hypothetical protein
VPFADRGSLMYNQNVLAAAPIGCDVHSKDRRLMTVALSNNVFWLQLFDG